MPETPREPTGEQCTARAPIKWNGETWYACWYPQMGGYVGTALLRPSGGCFEVYVWHDGEFPFSADSDGNEPPGYLHHCDPDQFIHFGEFAKSLPGMDREGLRGGYLMPETPESALTPEEWVEELRLQASSHPLDDGIAEASAFETKRSRHAIAAACLYGQPFGLTREEFWALWRCLNRDPWLDEEDEDHRMRDSAMAKIKALLPPEAPE